MEEFKEISLIRTIKLENIPENVSITSIIDLIRECEIETIHRDKNILYLTFFEYFIFYTAYFELRNKIKTINEGIKISFAKNEEISERKLLAFQAGASRSVYFNNIDDECDEKYFFDLAEPFGEIENIRYSQERKHAQIRFLRFESCMEFMKDFLNKETKNIKFGFHRPKNTNKAFHNIRTLYLGNIQSEILPKHIFKHVFSGSIYTLRFLRERKCAFLTFINPNSAEFFLQYYNKYPIIIGKIRIKITYGNNSIIPLPAILSLYENGASRAIYVFDLQCNCKFDNLEKRTVLEDKIKYSFFSMNAALQAVEILKQTYNEDQYAYSPDDSAVFTSSECFAYMLHLESKKGF